MYINKYLYLYVCIVLYCIALYYIILHYITLHYIILYCIILYYIILYDVVLCYVISYHIISYHIILYCIVLYCTVLYCMYVHVYIYIWLCMIMYVHGDYKRWKVLVPAKLPARLHFSPRSWDPKVSGIGCCASDVAPCCSNLINWVYHGKPWQTMVNHILQKCGNVKKSNSTVLSLVLWRCLHCGRGPGGDFCKSGDFAKLDQSRPAPSTTKRVQAWNQWYEDGTCLVHAWRLGLLVLPSGREKQTLIGGANFDITKKHSYISVYKFIKFLGSYLYACGLKTGQLLFDTCITALQRVHVSGLFDAAIGVSSTQTQLRRYSSTHTRDEAS